MTFMTPPSTSNPLLELHRQAEAEFQQWADIEIVQTFGVPQAEYASVRKNAGLIDLPQRGILELTGKDRLAFLNNLLSNQTWDKSSKSGLETGRNLYAFMLNLQGRIVVDMNVLEHGDRTLLEMDARLVEPLKNVLEKYLFAEQVKLTNRIGELHEIALHGPSAEQLLAKVPQNIVWRDDPTGTPGFHMIIPTESVQAAWTKLIEASARPIGWAAFNTARIEAGRAIFGIDFDGAPVATALPGKREIPAEQANIGALPAETGLLDRAVSFTKGCYLGQEIVARMHARAQVARQVAGIRMDGDALPIAGEHVLDAQSNPIGVVTSSTMSPLLSNAAICLVMLKKPHFTIGTKLHVPAEGAIRTATVVKLPFVQNPGHT